MYSIALVLIALIGCAAEAEEIDKRVPPRYQGRDCGFWLKDRYFSQTDSEEAGISCIEFENQMDLGISCFVYGEIPTCKERMANNE